MVCLDILCRTPLAVYTASAYLVCRRSAIYRLGMSGMWALCYVYLDAYVGALLSVSYTSAMFILHYRTAEARKR